VRCVALGEPAASIPRCSRDIGSTRGSPPRRVAICHPIRARFFLRDGESWANARPGHRSLMDPGVWRGEVLAQSPLVFEFGGPARDRGGVASQKLIDSASSFWRMYWVYGRQYGSFDLRFHETSGLPVITAIEQVSKPARVISQHHQLIQQSPESQRDRRREAKIAAAPESNPASNGFCICIIARRVSIHS